MNSLTNKIFYCIILILLLIGSLRIITTYDKLTVSPDELVHVATGLELIENGTYYLEALHPPFARVSVAIIPYLMGARLGDEFYSEYSHPFNHPDGYKKSFEGRNFGGRLIFFSEGLQNYKKMLISSRIGVLPYFILAGMVIAIWTRKHLGDYVAIYSTLFYSTLPIILANSGLATTDMPMCALFICTLFAFVNWLEIPSFKNTILFGVFFALLTITKFSGPIFFLIVAAPTIIVKDYTTGLVSRGFTIARVKSVAIISLITFLTIWVAYNFELAPLSYPYFLTPEKIATLKHVLNLSEEGITKIFSLKILPFPELFHGLSDLTDRVGYVYAGYIFGKVLIYHGVWYFFPAAALFKSPIPFLCFTGLGSCTLFKQFWSQKNWKIIIPLISAFTLLLASTTFNMNIGLRHLLPIFPLLCIMAGYGLYTSLHNHRLLIKLVAALLLGIYLITTINSHPFYVSYFNFLAGKTPEDILIDSDFDIGQELEYALTFPEVYENLDNIKLYYSGLADPKFFGFKNYVLYQTELHNKDFKIELGVNKELGEKYLLISIPLLKLLSAEKREALEKCKVIRKIGQTFMFYSMLYCS